MIKKLTTFAMVAAAMLGLAGSVNATVINLGEAGQYAVLGLNGTFVNLHNVSVNGDVGVGPNGSVNLGGPSSVNGTIFRDPTSTIVGNSGHAVNGFQIRDTHQAVQDAINASQAFAALNPTQSLSSISSAITFTGNGGDNVISLSGGINLGGGDNITLVGGPNDTFIFNIAGGLQMGGSASVVLQGITAGQVLFNFLGTGSTLMTHVGNMINGTVLAVDRDIVFHGVVGQVIGGGTELKLMSGAHVEFVPFIPEVTPSAVIFGFLGLIVALSSRRALMARVRAVSRR